VANQTAARVARADRAENLAAPNQVGADKVMAAAVADRKVAVRKAAVAAQVEETAENN
jgi:hypothetical protein